MTSPLRWPRSVLCSRNGGVGEGALRLGAHSGNRPRQRATYSFLTPPSWFRRPPNQAPSFFDASAVKAQIMTPEVRRSRRFEATSGDSGQ